MENLGLKKGSLELYDYSNDYPAIFEKEKKELLDIYKDKIKSIEHIGSTSIIGLKSKPIIDIVIQTDDLEDFIKYTESTVENDVYTVKKDQTMGGDFLIRKEEDGKVKAFIHVYKTGDWNYTRVVLFRDYLNTHEEERKRYQELKMALFDKCKDNETRKEYTHGKDAYIKRIVTLALNEKEKKLQN
jgi:GrpB-like predicted nucleotidyltransferase (UPF0157 family)